MNENEPQPTAQERIDTIDHQITFAAGLMRDNQQKIIELVGVNQRHAYDIQKMNVTRCQLVEGLKP